MRKAESDTQGYLIAPPDGSVRDAELELAGVLANEKRQVLLLQQLEVGREHFLQSVQRADLLVCSHSDTRSALISEEAV